MAVPATKLHSVAKAAAEDLRARVHFCPESGQIWLHEHRMLLVHAEAQALLRKELIDSLGMDRARGLLTRMGYASGLRDAELARTRAENCSDLEAFMTGPQLHTLEGIVRVTPVRIELDRASASFYGEFLWENSWEGQWHRHHYGIHSEPVCWTQIGYACGYTSAFMGRPILYKEVECVGMGHANCRIVGKPVEEWDDAAAHMRYFRPEAIADQLIDLQTQVVQLRSTIAGKDTLPADMIVAHPTSLTGSVGVIFIQPRVMGLMDKLGVRPDVYKSGKFKDMLSPDKADKDILPEEGQHWVSPTYICKPAGGMSEPCIREPGKCTEIGWFAPRSTWTHWRVSGEGASRP